MRIPITNPYGSTQRKNTLECFDKLEKRPRKSGIFTKAIKRYLVNSVKINRAVFKKTTGKSFIIHHFPFIWSFN